MKKISLFALFLLMAFVSTAQRTHLDSVLAKSGRIGNLWIGDTIRPTPQKVMVRGNSVDAGTLASLFALSYAGLVGTYLGDQVIDSAHSGTTLVPVGTGLSLIDLIPYLPNYDSSWALFIFSCGINDSSASASPCGYCVYRQDLANYLDTLIVDRGWPRSKIVVQSPPYSTGTQTDSIYVKINDSVARAFGVVFVDQYHSMKAQYLSGQWNGDGDGLHPGNMGHSIMARNIISSVPWYTHMSGTLTVTASDTVHKDHWVYNNTYLANTLWIGNSLRDSVEGTAISIKMPNFTSLGYASSGGLEFAPNFVNTYEDSFRLAYVPYGVTNNGFGLWRDGNNGGNIWNVDNASNFMFFTTTPQSGYRYTLAAGSEYISTNSSGVPALYANGGIHVTGNGLTDSNAINIYHNANTTNGIGSSVLADLLVWAPSADTVRVGNANSGTGKYGTDIALFNSNIIETIPKVWFKSNVGYGTSSAAAPIEVLSNLLDGNLYTGFLSTCNLATADPARIDWRRVLNGSKVTAGTYVAEGGMWPSYDGTHYSNTAGFGARVSTTPSTSTVATDFFIYTYPAGFQTIQYYDAYANGAVRTTWKASGHILMGKSDTSDNNKAFLQIYNTVDGLPQLSLHNSSSAANYATFNVNSSSALSILPGGTNGVNIASTGKQQWLGGYGTNTFTGTAASCPAFDASGNVIEISCGSGTNYQTVQAAGSSLTQRAKLNFSTKFTLSDNSGNGSTDVTLAATTLTSGVWTPTITTGTNVSAGTGNKCTYTRVDSIVTFAGSVNATVTVAATLSSINISIPISSTFTAITDANGTIGSNTALSLNPLNLFANISSGNTMTITFGSGTSTGGYILFFSGQYVIH